MLVLHQQYTYLVYASHIRISHTSVLLDWDEAPRSPSKKSEAAVAKFQDSFPAATCCNKICVALLKYRRMLLHGSLTKLMTIR